MTTPRFCRAGGSANHSAGGRVSPAPAFRDVDLAAVAKHMLPLTLRNVASDGFLLSDRTHPGRVSRPGCIIAAPSYPADLPGDEQDYVFNWVRDAAVVAIEIAAAGLPRDRDGGVGALVDYVQFADLCQNHAAPTLAHACFTIDGRPRPWSEQSDGPALQTIACLRIHDQLDETAKPLALRVVDRNVRFLLGAYREPTHNLWEEHEGQSFFARSVQLRCLEEVAGNRVGYAPPPGLDEARAWLAKALAGHWNGSHYVSLLASGATDGAGPPRSAVPDYDPNIDVVCAAIYGHVSCLDPKLLATAAALRRQWSDPSLETFYPINGDDRVRGIGPLLGRYPGDRYDGDLKPTKPGGHPWALCTCNAAELYYRVAASVGGGAPLPTDDLSRDFFEDVGITAGTSREAAAQKLLQAGDAMLRAVLFHSDNYELSEQFDGTTGFEKSLRNLSWSYAAFLSAVRGRNAALGRLAGGPSDV